MVVYGWTMAEDLVKARQALNLGLLTEFREVVRNRRMTRAFASEPIDPALVDDLVDLASRAPSAGKTQGWHVVVLEGADQIARYWDITLPADKRASFRWQHLLDAPVLMLPLADPSAYVERYAEPDKARTGLGDGVDAWPAPYWTIDTSMAVMTLLLAAEDRGLGALFFGVFHTRPRCGPSSASLTRSRSSARSRSARPLSDDEPGRSSTAPGGHRIRSFTGVAGSRLPDTGQRLHELVDGCRGGGTDVVPTDVGLSGGPTLPQR